MRLLRRAIQFAALGLFLYLFLALAWPYSSGSGAIGLSERVPLELFLWLDPLVGICAAIATRHWNIALVGAGAILLAGILVPRVFCGYLCPLGTLIDGFDWLIRWPMRRLRLKQVGQVANLRYCILVAVVIAAVFGVLLSAVFSPIPVLTRAMEFTAARLELGLRRNWSMLAPLSVGMYVSLGLFAVIFLLSILAPRFWCRYVCPSGAAFSLGSALRLFERRTTAACTHCGRCQRACPFDAINTDHSTRPMECAFCRTCAGVCREDAIRYSSRRKGQPRSAEREPRTVSRRGLLASAVGGALAAGITRSLHAKAAMPLRPPGSVREELFLDLCIRCDECLKVCPGAMLRPAGLEAGIEAIWTPVPDFLHAGCHPDCNFCTLVCPTHAIRPLTIEEKRRTPMGLAVIDKSICLGHRSDTECDPELSLRLGEPSTPCIQECRAAGYKAISMQRIRIEIGNIPEGAVSPEELEAMSHINVPVIDKAACVGCGLCEYRCHVTLVKQRSRISRRAITVAPLSTV